MEGCVLVRLAEVQIANFLLMFVQVVIELLL